MPNSKNNEKKVMPITAVKAQPNQPLTPKPSLNALFARLAVAIADVCEHAHCPPQIRRESCAYIGNLLELPQESFTIVCRHALGAALSRFYDEETDRREAISGDC